MLWGYRLGLLSCGQQTVLSRVSHSAVTSVLVGVPQGSVLGPLLCSVYVVDPLPSIIEMHGIDHRGYMDDRQLYTTFKMSGRKFQTVCRSPSTGHTEVLGIAFVFEVVSSPSRPVQSLYPFQVIGSVYQELLANTATTHAVVFGQGCFMQATKRKTV